MGATPDTEESEMSVFSNLSKADREAVFSGAVFKGDWLPTGEIMPDGSIQALTREGWNTFRLVGYRAGAKGKSPYGANSLWRCDLSMRGMRRIAGAERADAA